MTFLFWYFLLFWWKYNNYDEDYDLGEIRLNIHIYVSLAIR